eukprot:Nk52_evm12s302 gene=Nk52_evmTU12s302
MDMSTVVTKTKLIKASPKDVWRVYVKHTLEVHSVIHYTTTLEDNTVREPFSPEVIEKEFANGDVFDPANIVPKDPEPDEVRLKNEDKPHKVIRVSHKDMKGFSFDVHDGVRGKYSRFLIMSDNDLDFSCYEWGIQFVDYGGNVGSTKAIIVSKYSIKSKARRFFMGWMYKLGCYWHTRKTLNSLQSLCKKEFTPASS